jgi:hypothetical protein
MATSALIAMTTAGILMDTTVLLAEIPDPRQTVQVLCPRRGAERHIEAAWAQARPRPLSAVSPGRSFALQHIKPSPSVLK